MLESSGIHICFNADGREIEILDVTPFGKDKFRIEETPIFNPAVTMGDIIQVKEENGVYYYQETVQKSPFKRYAWLLSKEAVDSTAIADFKHRIIENEGKCELIFGGLFVIHIPKNTSIDVDGEMNRIIERFEI
ncbi:MULTISPECIES: DUF4265 domain-containing protein [Paenibacillus]|uniref:Uncharacterized protein n=2 Tax=Paenibacillus TaxID=44249 RepID=A0A1R0X2G7_9BACL|nr:MULTISPECIES: DUF4265 domain-containing protein [Paenibacillus]AIQ73777.1 hypothetical protein PODO_11235 [Paenibacillus odorifer]ETT45110.1 hypothetical protein C171_32728 [Paenibacillus sp. FSL H8-237]MEC0130784.1 DUF4265 domain-containing protein [Paenibacillus odorifer]MEC0220989.1 DUF4265 domain-containing protein [Paenibacillus odorifer]OMC97614.1 hypothetical protein BJP46_26140 [Paenibacillus odorifer]